ncbi:hypothetical protein D3C80_1851800 [compost metagenome]
MLSINFDAASPKWLESLPLKRLSMAAKSCGSALRISGWFRSEATSAMSVSLFREPNNCSA